jgi:hypothetical protein
LISNLPFSDYDIDKLPQHPIARGLDSICHARSSILDSYCRPNSPFERLNELEALFTEIVSDTFLVDKEKIEDIKLGMRGRNITSFLIDSIQGEISSWADDDRSVRGTPASLKYYV